MVRHGPSWSNGFWSQKWQAGIDDPRLQPWPPGRTETMPSLDLRPWDMGCRGGEKTVLMNWGTRSLGVISVQVSTLKQQVDQEHMNACIQCW